MIDAKAFNFSNMAANAKDLITLADIKTFLGITVTTYDTVLQDLVTGVSLYIANYTDRDLIDAVANVTEYRDGGFGDSVLVKKYPLKTIVSVSILSGPLNAPTWWPLNPIGDYNFRPENGEVYFNFRPAKGRQNVQIIYTGGYIVGDSTYPVPFDLQLAAKTLIAKFYQKRFAQGITNERIGEAGVNWNEDLDPTTIRLLEPFKRMTL